MGDTIRMVVVNIRPLRHDQGPVTIIKVEWGARKIKPSHGRHVTGRFPLGKGKGSVPYESGLESEVIAMLLSYPGLVGLQAQPLTLEAWVGNTKVVYTTDFLVEYDPLPQSLADAGFGPRTFIEAKPLKYCNDEEVHLKLNVLKAATGLPALLITRYEEDKHA